VALVLLLAPDSHTGFGLIFLGLVLAVTVSQRARLATWLHSRSMTPLASARRLVHLSM
jgi:hypothetical protein